MFSVIIITIGIPGSGKSYWVYNYKKKHPLTHVISTDEIRKEVTGTYDCDPKDNDYIHNIALERARTILNTESVYPIEIIIDATNCEMETWLSYKNLHPSILRAIVFECTPEEAMRLQSLRERVVPIEILQNKWETIEKNKKYLIKIFNRVDIKTNKLLEYLRHNK